MSHDNARFAFRWTPLPTSDPEQLWVCVDQLRDGESQMFQSRSCGRCLRLRAGKCLIVMESYGGCTSCRSHGIFR
jgi:hypothetical protein